jgi:hypothetical protein
MNINIDNTYQIYKDEYFRENKSCKKISFFWRLAFAVYVENWKFHERNKKTIRCNHHQDRLKNQDNTLQSSPGGINRHFLVFHINTFILITLRCVYIYRERSIIIVDTHSMVVASFNF